MERRRVVVATGNAGKLREIRAALDGCGLELISRGELGIGGCAEPHCTFLENALAKARHCARAAQLPALADDSGLVVAALGGAPGVFSARYAGEGASDEENNCKLLREIFPPPAPPIKDGGGVEVSSSKMDGGDNEKNNRGAFYYAAMVFVCSAGDSAPLVAEGFWRGEILSAPRGNNGFGYDSLFYDSAVGKTGAEMTAAEKNRVSHRGKSLRVLVAGLARRGIIPAQTAASAGGDDYYGGGG